MITAASEGHQTGDSFGPGQGHRSPFGPKFDQLGQIPLCLILRSETLHTMRQRRRHRSRRRAGGSSVSRTRTSCAKISASKRGNSVLPFSSQRLCINRRGFGGTLPCQVWRKGSALTKKIDPLTQRFPADEKFRWVSQLRRAAISVPSTVKEDRARRSRDEFAQFLSVVPGSACRVGAPVDHVQGTRMGRRNSYRTTSDANPRVPEDAALLAR